MASLGHHRLVLDNYENDYGNLIKKNSTTTMEIKRLQTLATEIFKIMNNINPSYKKNIFTPKTNAKIRPHIISLFRFHNFNFVMIFMLFSQKK